MNLAEIAKRLDGRLEGDGAIEIKRVASLSEAGQGDLSFLSNPRYASDVATTHASAVLVNDDWDGSAPCAIIRVKDADRAFGLASPLFSPPPAEFEPGIHPSAVVAADVSLGERVHIGPHCVLANGVVVGSGSVIVAGCYLGHGVVMGADCRLYPLVCLREGSRLGERATIHSGAVIGSDGFGYAQQEGAWKKIPQVGIVEIGNDVEIGANTTIDRARFGKTIIGNGVKIDNLVQIAHNVRIGDNTVIAACVGISGSATIGRNVRIGGQAGFAGHITVGDNAVVGAGGGVTKDVPPGAFVSDYPAMDHRKAGKMHANIRRLPHLREKVQALELRLNALEKENQS